MDDRESVVDPQLLSVIDPTKHVPRRFDLGMSDFVGTNAFDENQDPAPRKLSLALKKRPKAPSSESGKLRNCGRHYSRQCLMRSTRTTSVWPFCSFLRILRRTTIGHIRILLLGETLETPQIPTTNAPKIFYIRCHLILMH